MRDKIRRALRLHPLLAILLLAFLSLAVTYAMVTPIFEAGDEIWHYPYVQYLATGHSLPVQAPAVKTLWAQEGGQPPLYYSLSALATFWIDASDLPERLWYNPHAKIGIPLLSGNKNMVVHTSAENFPWRHTALAVHLIRFLSILFSVGTVALTYFLALEIRDDKVLAVVAAAFVAFNPMFIFISASVNNDSLAAMLAALALLLLARLISRGATIRRYLALGITLGLAAITKTSDLGLVLVAAAVFAYLWRRESSASHLHAPRVSAPPRLRVGSFLSSSPTLFLGPVLAAALVIAIAGWWYLRNYLLYSDPFAFNVWVAIAGGRPTPATLTTLLDEFQGMRISFWGNFGGVNIIAPEWVYSVLDAMALLAAFGLLMGLLRRTLPRLLALPAFWFALIFVALIRWTMLTLASQGRLLFPAISAIAVLFAFGFEQIRFPKLYPRIRISPAPPATTLAPPARAGVVPEAKRSGRAGLQPPPGGVNFGFAILNLPFVIFLFAFSAFTPFALIAPTYALPKRLAADANVPNAVHIAFEDQAELIGYDLPQKSVMPNNELPITLYWRGIQPMVEDYSVYIHLFDSSGKPVGQWDAYPGNGAYPTRLWQSEIIVDPYRVPIAGDARGPGVGRIEIGLYRKEALKNLVARDPQGRSITPSIAKFKIAGPSRVQVENPVRYVFGNQIALMGYSIPQETKAGGSLPVRLYWRALEPMNEDYTVFVHVVDAQGKLISQKDDQPQHGEYPTSFWDPGETVADDYVIDIPRDAASGDYKIRLGLYRARDNSRLFVDGSDHIDLTTIHLIPP